MAEGVFFTLTFSSKKERHTCVYRIYFGTDGYIFPARVFPPKAFADMEQAAAVTREIAALEPDFISVTYGAARKNPCPYPGAGPGGGTGAAGRPCAT